MSLVDQQWCPTSVQVTVLQARGLRSKGKSGTNDAYALMQVGKEKYQTSVVEKSVAPVWKEEAAFDLPAGGGGGGGGGGCTLHVHVLHRALVGLDKLLGQAVINLLQLSEDKTRNKTEWFKLLDKTGKPDKDRGEVLVDIQFMRNNMTASMFDLSGAGKSKSRLGKFKDKVRGKKKESDAACTALPSFTQVLTDSEEEEGGGEVASGKDGKKKKHKMKSLFSPKSNLQKNMSQSMSVLPGKNSSLTGSQSSGLNVDSSEGKKKFKFMIHKRSGSSDSKDSSQKHVAAEQSNLCINGSHVYCEEPPPRTSRIGSNFSLASSGHGSMEDVPESSPPSVDSLRAVRQYSPWTEEEEEEVENIKEDVGDLRRGEEERIRVEEEMRRKEEERVRREEEEHERLAEEKRRREEEERRRAEEERAQEERKRAEEEKVQREEEERIRMEEERKRKEEEEERVRRQEEELKRLAEEKRRREEVERVKKEEEERVRMEEEMRRKEEERVRRENEELERLAEENRRQEEEERFKREEEERIWRVEEERRRKEEEERVRREEEEERERLAEEKRRLEEEERKRIEEEEKRQREEEERIRLKEEMAQEERRRQEEEEGARRLEEEHKLEEEKRRLEEERRRIEEEKVRKEEKERAEEEKMLKRQEEEKRKLEEEGMKQREEEERIKKEEERKQEEEEKAKREREEYERLAEEKRKLEEGERKKIEAEERIRREEEQRIRIEEERRRKEEEDERIRVEEEKRRKEEEEERVRIEEERRRKEEEEEMLRRQEEEREKLAEEKRKLEEQERRRLEEEEQKRQREDEERIRKEVERRQEEEERARKEKEEMERLAEEKRRLEEQERKRTEEEERKRRGQKAEEERKEEEARKLEKEKKENQTKPKSARMKSKMTVEIPAGDTTNPFDENYSNPFEENSPAGPDSSTDRCRSVVSSLGSKPVSTDEKDLISSQRERRPAPQPPGRNQAERPSQREQDGSTRHLAQINKQSKDKDAKTASVLPQRSVQMIAPLSRSPADAKNTQTQSSTTKGAATAKHSKRPAPSRPRSVEEGPSAASSSDGNTSHERASNAKQEPVYGLNPFEDDEDELTDDTTSGNTAPTQWPPAAPQTADSDAASQTKIKSSKAPAPPLPTKKDATSSTLMSRNTEGGLVTDDTVPDNGETHARDPESDATSPVHVQESPLQEAQTATVQSAGEEAGGKKKEEPLTAPRRLQPVKPLNPLEQQSVSVAQGEKDKKSTGILCEVQEKKKVNDTCLKGPYSQLTREELISLVLKQENQLSERHKKISELERYIDNLLVRVMEEQPSILMSLSSLKKAA